MNKTTKVSLLSLIAIVQVLSLVGGFIAYEQMSEATSRLDRNYHELSYEVYPWLKMGPNTSHPNPFALLPLILLVLLGLLGLFSTVVLLIDQIRHQNGR